MVLANPTNNKAASLKNLYALCKSYTIVSPPFVARLLCTHKHTCNTHNKRRHTQTRTHTLSHTPTRSHTHTRILSPTRTHTHTNTHTHLLIQHAARHKSYNHERSLRLSLQKPSS